MGTVDDYLATLDDDSRATIGHLYHAPDPG
jgi:hypothetical protein